MVSWQRQRRSIFFDDVKHFCDDMGTTGTHIFIWACMFPFAQYIFGSFSCILISPRSIGAFYLYGRHLSFIIAGQVHKRFPFSKKMAPRMHIPLFILLPFAYRWILDHQNDESYTFLTAGHYYFVIYTTIITSISLVLDVTVAIKWFILGQDVGKYKSTLVDSNRHRDPMKVS